MKTIIAIFALSIGIISCSKTNQAVTNSIYIFADSAVIITKVEIKSKTVSSGITPGTGQTFYTQSNGQTGIHILATIPYPGYTLYIKQNNVVTQHFDATIINNFFEFVVDTSKGAIDIRIIKTI